MSLPPEQKELVDNAVRRKVAIAALKRIHRLIDEDSADERRGQRFAAIATGVVMAVAALVVAWFTVRGVMLVMRFGVPSEAALTSGALSLFLRVMVIGSLAWMAAYLWAAFPGPARRYVKHGALSTIAAAILACALYAAFVSVR